MANKQIPPAGQKGFLPIIFLGISLLVGLSMAGAGYYLYLLLNSPAPTREIRSKLDDYASLADLRIEDAIKIQMPGSTALLHVGKKEDCGGSEKAWTIEGIVPASYSCNIYGTNASIDEVIGFYDTQLAQAGWTKGGEVTRGSTEFKVVGYCKPKKVFRLGFPDPARYSTLTQNLSYKTIFTPTLQGKNSEAECPHPF